jgi:hypothetical protein
MTKEQYEPPDTMRPSLGGTEPFDALFEHARRDAFTPQESERLWQNVVSAGPGVGDAGPDFPEGPTRGWTSSAALKVTAAPVVAGGLLVAGFAARKSAPPEPVSARSGAPAPGEAAPGPRIEGGPPVVSWEDLPRAQGEAHTATPSPRAHAPSVPPPEAPPASGSELVGSTGAGAMAAPVETEAPPAPAATPVPGPSEGALLLRARQQLASDPSSALALTDEAGRRFPDGALAPEREVLAIEALARLGRLPSARARLAAFRVAYPRSPHLARLESLVTP